MTLRNLVTSLGNPGIIASKLGPDIDKVILSTIIEGYGLLKRENIVKSDWEEDRITLELYYRLQQIWKRSTCSGVPVPIHQFPIYPKENSRGRPPTIDIVFRHGYLEGSYFGFECKRLDLDERRLIRQYVGENGMLRFITGKYSRGEKVGGMIGYVLNGKLGVVVKLINEEVIRILDISDRLKKGTPVRRFRQIYLSNHIKRIKKMELLLYHLFFTFSV